MALTRNEITQRAFAEMDRAAWDAVQHDFAERFERQGDIRSPDKMFRLEKNYAKYFDLEKWFQYHTRHAMTVGLHETDNPLRILDLGCGAGVFLYIAKVLGHGGVGLDLASEMYRRMAGVLDVDWRASPILANTPLPEELSGFDLISAIAIKFDRLDWGPQDAEPWTLTEWEFLLRDAATRLNPGGRILIKPNYHIHPTPTQEGVYFKDHRIFEFLSEVATDVTPNTEFVIPGSALI